MNLMPCKLHAIGGKKIDPPELVVVFDFLGSDTKALVVLQRPSTGRIETRNLLDVELESLARFGAVMPAAGLVRPQ